MTAWSGVLEGRGGGLFEERAEWLSGKIQRMHMA